MNQDETKLLDTKTDYLSCMRLFFKNRKNPSTGVPRAFHKIDSHDPRWTKNPQNLLPVFQKILLSIPDSERLMIGKNLKDLVKLKDKSAVENDRFCLQDEIFHGVTGYYYFKLLPPYLMSHEGIREKNFYWLIRSGILAYEKMPPEKRRKFNKAVMPDVKEQNIVVPNQRQQYIE